MNLLLLVSGLGPQKLVSRPCKKGDFLSTFRVCGCWVDLDLPTYGALTGWGTGKTTKFLTCGPMSRSRCWKTCSLGPPARCPLSPLGPLTKIDYRKKLVPYSNLSTEDLVTFQTWCWASIVGGQAALAFRLLNDFHWLKIVSIFQRCFLAESIVTGSCSFHLLKNMF